MFKKIALGVAATALVAVAGAAQAQDSQFGATSQDTFTLTATVDPVVRISGLTDLTFNIGAAFLNGGNPNVTQRPYFCVYSNVTNAGTYELEVTGVPYGTGSDNRWSLNGSGGARLAYTVNNNTGSSASNRQLGPGDSFAFAANAFTGARPNTADCSDIGGHNNQLVVAFSRGDVLAANAGTYTGTVTVIAKAI